MLFGAAMANFLLFCPPELNLADQQCPLVTLQPVPVLLPLPGKGTAVTRFWLHGPKWPLTAPGRTSRC
jgi:hypothetical protein